MELTEQDRWTAIASLGWTAETWRKLAAEESNPPNLSALMIANAERAEELRDRLAGDDSPIMIDPEADDPIAESESGASYWPDSAEYAEREIRGG